MQKILVLALLAAAQAAVQKCVPTNQVVEIKSAKDAIALAQAIICTGVTVRAVVSGTVQPSDTITVGAKSKLIISASTKALKPAIIDGQGTVQLFNVLAGGELSLQNVVLSKGFAAAEGGGILSAAETTISLLGATMQGHTAARGAAIFTNGSVSIDQVSQHLL
jgi:hypothetical protein